MEYFCILHCYSGQTYPLKRIKWIPSLYNFSNIVGLVPFGSKKRALDNNNIGSSYVLGSHRQSGKFLIFTCMHGIFHFDDCTRIIQSSFCSCCITVWCCVVFHRFHILGVCVCVSVHCAWVWVYYYHYFFRF